MIPIFGILGNTCPNYYCLVKFVIIYRCVYIYIYVCIYIYIYFIYNSLTIIDVLVILKQNEHKRKEEIVTQKIVS